MRRRPFQLLPRLFAVVGTGAVLLLAGSPCSTAFTTPTRVGHCISSTPLEALSPLTLQDVDVSSLLSTSTTAPTQIILAANNDDISLEDAFQDSISFTDGPVGVLLAAFGVFVVLAVGFKAVMAEMDGAIEKVLEDFESSLKRYYPKRWNKIEEEYLVGLSGDERGIKLLQVMEQLQRDEPEFMTKLANRGGDGDDN